MASRKAQTQRLRASITSFGYTAVLLYQEVYALPAGNFILLIPYTEFILGHFPHGRRQVGGWRRRAPKKHKRKRQSKHEQKYRDSGQVVTGHSPSFSFSASMIISPSSVAKNTGTKQAKNRQEEGDKWRPDNS